MSPDDTMSWSPPDAITATSIERLVRAFYDRVQADTELGPVFNDAIHDWPAHMVTLTDFWTSVMLGSGRYKGRPVPAHFRHRDRITPELFLRWLGLWRQTANMIFAPADAKAFEEKAELIARSLQYALHQRLPAPPR